MFLPPLRERSEDIPEFINYYMQKTAQKLNKHSVNISDEYMKYLIAYDWPGNVRELENVIELMINSEEPQINFNDKIDEVKKNTVNLNTNISLELMEKQHITKVLKDVKGNMTLAANILEIGRNTLYRKIEKFDIDCSKIDHCSKVEQ